MISAAAHFRRSLKLLALALLAGCPALALAQLPPPNVLLTEPRPALLAVGPMDIHVRASTSFVYDDNINLHQQRRVSDGIGTGGNQAPQGDDFIYTFSPGVVVTKAETLEDSRSKFSVEYSPAFVFFIKNDRENSIDHTAKLEGGYALTKLTLGLVQDFASTAGGVIDVGTRVRQKNYRTAITMRYELTEKTFFQTDGTYRITDYQTLTGSEEWSVVPTVNYQISPKVTLGLGLTYGELLVGERTSHSVTNGTNITTFTTVKPQPQTYLGPTLRASYKTTEKTDVSLSVGAEWRMYSDGSSAFSPVFSLAGTYRPFEGTSLAIEGHRRQQNSAVLNGANFISTGASISVRQRLRERLFGTMSVTLDNSDYQPAHRGVQTTRQDDYFLLRYGVEAIVGRSWSVGLFHQYREDISTEKNFSFNNNQVGIQASWGY